MTMPAMSATAHRDGDENTGLSADGDSEKKQHDSHTTHRLPPCRWDERWPLGIPPTCTRPRS